MITTPQLAPGEGLMKLCPRCGGTILPRSIGGARRGTCHCPLNLTTTTEKKMTKKQKRQLKGILQEVQNPSQESAKVAEEIVAPQTPAKEPKAPKPISFDAQGEVKAAKQGSKLAALIDALATGSTMEQLVKVLSASGSAVDASGVRAWLSYD